LVESLKTSKQAGIVVSWIVAIALLSVVASGPALAVDKLKIEFGPGGNLLPYELIKLRETDFGPKKLPVSDPAQVYRPQRLETDTAYIVHAFNRDIFSDNPAVFSLNNATYPGTIDHDPVYANLNSFKLFYDDRAETTAIAAGCYRNDSAFVLKSFPGSNEFEFLFLATGQDLTGDDHWRGVVTFSNAFDYDFDGSLEIFCYVDPGRDLIPRLLCCVELSTMTLEWSLPVASAVSLDQLYVCGDSASPEIIFSTYNYRNGVEDANFSDLYCYLTRVDANGHILDSRILSEEHGSKGLWRGPSQGTFFLFHALPLIKPDSFTEGQEHHYQLSKIDREFNSISCIDLDKRVRQAWLADYREDGVDDLYVLFYGGEVRIYDTTLTLLARSEETSLLNFVDSIRVGDDLRKVYIFNTADGTALYSHDFKWLGEIDVPIWICHPLKYGPAGQVRQFIATHENAYRIIQVSQRSKWELVRNTFQQYQVYILAISLILLLLVIWSNVYRLRAQRQLLETREQLRSVCDNVHDVIYRADMQGVLVWVTSSGMDLLGYDRVEDLIGLSLKTIYEHPEQRDVLLELLKKHGSVTDYEVQLRRRDGSTVMVSTSTAYWRDKAGKVIGVEGVVRNITARKKAEQALRESEEKYRNLFYRAQVGMYRSTLDGSSFLAVNQKLAEMYGSTVEELLAGPSLARWEDPVARKKLIDKLKQQGEVFDYEITILNKQGERRTLLASARLYPDEQYVEGTLLDITERKRARQALRESEERYHTLTESSPDGIMAADPKTLKIVFVNSAMCALTGYSSEELLSLSVGDLSEKSHRDMAVKAFQNIARGRTDKAANLSVLRKNKSTVTVDVRAVQEQLDGRTVILGFFRDVSELRQKELLLRQRTASLKRLSNRLIDLQENDRKFVARELHDTVAQNLALSKIKIETAALICPEPDNAAIKEASAHVTDAIHHLKNISAELRPQMLDELGLGPTIEWYLNNYTEGLDARFKIKGKPLKLDAKKQINLFRVFQELMLNMKKHSGADRIDVLLEYSSNYLTLTVEDNGRGFDLDKVTNSWWSSSTFGLMNITERVEIVGGEFVINTKEGKGATFIVTIPGN